MRYVHLFLEDVTTVYTWPEASMTTLTVVRTARSSNEPNTVYTRRFLTADVSVNVQEFSTRLH